MCFAPQRRPPFRHFNFWKKHPTLCVFKILTWTRASRHNGAHCFHSRTSKSGPTPTWKYISCQNGVQLFTSALARWLRKSMNRIRLCQAHFFYGRKFENQIFYIMDRGKSRVRDEKKRSENIRENKEWEKKWGAGKRKKFCEWFVALVEVGSPKRHKRCVLNSLTCRQPRTTS